MEAPPNTNIYIADLPAGIDVNTVQTIFSEYGTIVQCKIKVMPGNAPGRKTAAMVQFSTIDEAKWIKDNLDGNIPQGLREPVIVKYADTPEIKAAKAMGMAGGCGDCGGKADLADAAAEAEEIPELPMENKVNDPLSGTTIAKANDDGKVYDGVVADIEGNSGTPTVEKQAEIVQDDLVLEPNTNRTVSVTCSPDEARKIRQALRGVAARSKRTKKAGFRDQHDKESSPTCLYFLGTAQTGRIEKTVQALR
eukprot:symbB.v1.2.027846.t1/scaffold2885.1/size67989/4